MSVSPACISVHCVGAWYPWRLEKGIRSPGAGVTYGGEPSYGCWELNPAALQEPGILIPEPSLQDQPFLPLCMAQGDPLSSGSGSTALTSSAHCAVLDSLPERRTLVVFHTVFQGSASSWHLLPLSTVAMCFMLRAVALQVVTVPFYLAIAMSSSFFHRLP